MEKNCAKSLFDRCSKHDISVHWKAVVEMSLSALMPSQEPLHALGSSGSCNTITQLEDREIFASLLFSNSNNFRSFHPQPDIIVAILLGLFPTEHRAGRRI